MDESLEDGPGGGGRLVVGNANSASMSSLATSPGGRAGDATECVNVPDRQNICACCMLF